MRCLSRFMRGRIFMALQHAACLAGGGALIWGCAAALPNAAEIAASSPEQLPALLARLETAQREDPEDGEIQLLLAKALLRAGEAKRAEPLALAALRSFPFEGEVLHLLGEIYFAEQKRFQALGALAEAIRLDPERLPAYLRLGEVYQLLGRNAEAEQILKDSLRRKPSYYPAQLALARLLLAESRLAPAWSAVTRARQLRPLASEAELLEIQIKKAQGRLSSAAQRVQQALTAPALSPEQRQSLLREMLDIHRQRQQWERAWQLLLDFEGQGEASPTDALIKLEVLRGRGQHKEAFQLLGRLKERYPSNGQVLLAAARIDILRGAAAAALAPLESVIERQGNLVEAYYWKALAHFQLGQHQEGDAALSTAAALAPTFPPVRLLRAQRMLRTGRLAQAAELLEAQLAAFPGDGNTLLAKAELQTLQGDYSAAERTLAAIPPAHTDDALRFAKARLAYLRGAYLAALDKTTPLIKRRQAPWQLIYLHSAALLRLGRGSKALPLLQSRIKRKEGGGALERLLGDIQQLQGAPGKARRSYLAGLSRFPRHIHLLEGLTRLEVEAGRWEQAGKWLKIGSEKPGPHRARFLERLNLVHRKLKQPQKAARVLARYLAETDPLLQEGKSFVEQAILFNDAFFPLASLAQ